MRTDTRIVLGDLLGGLVGLLSIVFVRRIQRASAELSDDAPKPKRFSPREAVFGALSAIGTRYIDDRDIAGVRSRVRRWIGFTLGKSILHRRIGSNDLADSWAFALGHSLGAIAHRVWFGIVRPIPEPRLEHRGFLPWRR